MKLASKDFGVTE